METITITPNAGFIEITSISKKLPDYGPLNLCDIKKLAVKKAANNFSHLVPVYCTNVDTLEIDQIFSNEQIAADALGVKRSTISHRIIRKNIFKFDNQKLVLFREEELTQTDLISNTVSRIQFNKIISSVKEEKARKKLAKENLSAMERRSVGTGAGRPTEVCIVNLLGNIIKEFPSIYAIMSAINHLTYAAIYWRLCKTVIFTFDDQKVIFIRKKDISASSLEVMKLTNEEMNEVIEQGSIDGEIYNKKNRIRNTPNIVSTKQDLVENFREQHGETKEFAPLPSFLRRKTRYSRIIRKFNKGEITDEIIENFEIVEEN